MKILIITRHEATVEWIKKTIHPFIGVTIDEIVVTAHYTPGMEDGFNYVIGILPVNLIAALCAKEIHYYQVVMDISVEFRGKELTIEQMEEFNAHLVRYYVEEL